MLNNSFDKTHTSAIKLKKGKATFADNVLTLTGGATIAFGVTVLTSPITSRLFGPEAFGLAALFMSGATVTGLIACMRYEMAIALPKNNEEAASLFILCCIILTATTTFTSILSLILGHRVLVYLDAVELKPYLWLFPVYVLLIGSRFLFTYWHMRHKRFKISATSSVLINFPTAIAEVTGGLSGFTTGGNLVAVRTLGLIISPAFLLWHLLRFDTRFIIANINLKGIIESAKRYIKFPLFDSWSTLLQNLSRHAPIILLPALFSSAVAGLYAKAFYLLLLPSLIIGQSIGKVFLQESADSRAKGRNLAGLVGAVFNRMITIGTLPFAILFIIGPELFGFFLGTRWTEAGVYAQIMMPWLFISFLSVSIETLFGTLAKQELNLIVTVFLMVMQVGGLVFGGIVLHDARLTVFILTIASALILLWRISLLLRATGLPIYRPLSHFFRCAAYAIPSISLISIMKWWLRLDVTYLLVLIPFFSIPYLAFVMRHDLELRDLLTKNLQRVHPFR